MNDASYVDPEVAPVLEALKSGYGDYAKLSVAETRALFARNSAATDPPLPEGCEDGRFTIAAPDGAIACRYFRPKGAASTLPVLVYFLGGTYVAVSLDHLGPVPPALALDAQCMVVVPLHRVPPEHPYPAAYDDCLAVYRWLLDHAGSVGGDAARIVLGGESSGGTLAAAVCIDARDNGLPQPRMQLLAEPLLDHQSETASINRFEYVLCKADIRRGSRMYFGDAPPPTRASPLRAESLAGVAPAYVISAALDPLCDEAIAFVERLRREGVLVMHRHHEGQPHGFFSLIARSTQARIAFHECCAVLRLAFDAGLTLPR